MTFLHTILYVLGSLAAIGLCAGGLGFLISQYRSGYRKTNTEVVSSSTEIITFYKTENQSLKDIMGEKDKSNDEKFRQLTSEIGEIRGQLIEKEKQNKQYLDIINNRGPETEQFQSTILDGLAKLATIIGEIHTLAIQEHERELSITSTITKE